MATTSIPHRWTYDVFVSFRGEDIRKSFMDHLFKDFRQKGIHAFRDDNQLPRGEEISSQLYKAIEESRFLIVIFSKNYASSSWCLRELVKILECKQMGHHKHDIQIIFYDVKPDVVRKQTGCYAEAFTKHEFSNRKEVAKWKEALSMAANLSGWDLQEKANGYESKLIDSISKEILQNLCHGPLHVGENLVGVDARVKQMNLLRFVGSSEVHMIGICGISGIGKTTLAKAIYNLIYIHFEECSFCDDVQGITKQHGLNKVVKQLIHDIMKTSDVKISNIDRGVMVMKQRIASRRILLVLDGVDHHKQLEALAGSCEWFSPGSLIIFTSQDKQLLRCHKVEEIFDMEFLEYGEALELLSLYAFNKRHPTEDFKELAHQVVRYVQGHPFALKVLGGFLCGKTVPMWISELDKLQIHPNTEIQEVFRLCFNGLDIVQQEMLLDIATYLIGERKDFAESVLDSCGFFAHTNMQVLLDKSLTTISRTMSLEMHDLIRGMAREIVREESKWPGDRSRLWMSSEVCDVLKKNKVTEAVEVLVLRLEKSSQKVDIDVKAFAHMKKLRILKVCYPEYFEQTYELKDSHVNFSGILEFLSIELRLLYWHGYPFKFLPSNFYPENIVVVDMSCSHIENLWTETKCFRRLKVMKLRHCRNLSSTPDFTEMTNLEELILEGCVNLVEVHPSIAMLKRLVVLNMRNCTRLRNFPCKVEMDSLEVLDLSGCPELYKLPEKPSFVSSMRKVLAIGRHGGIRSKWGTSIFQPSWILTKVQHPQSFVLPFLSSLCLLRSLDVSYCNISEVSPDSIGGLSCLEQLKLSGNNFTSLPASLSQLSQLSELCLKDCKKLEVMPELPPHVVWFDWSSFCDPFTNRSVDRSVLDRIVLDCTSLRQLQKLPVMPFSFLLHFFLTSGSKLVEKFTFESLMYMSMNPQGLDYLSRPLDIHFQGSIIPQFFTNQNTGNKVKVELPPSWCYDKFRGPATYVVFTPKKPCGSKAKSWPPFFKVENFDNAFLGSRACCFGNAFLSGSDVIWFHYSKKDFWGWHNAENFVTFSFGNDEDFEVKAFGVRLVCDEDIQEEEMWGSSMIQLQGLPTPTQNAGGVFHPNDQEWISGTIEEEPLVKKSRTV